MKSGHYLLVFYFFLSPATQPILLAIFFFFFPGSFVSPTQPHSLQHLDLSDNNLLGPVPKQLSSLTQLLTLAVPDLFVSLVNLKELNQTRNELYGWLPDRFLTKFGEKSFSGN